LTSLVKKVNAVNNEQGKKMGSFVVLLSDEESMEKKLKALAEKEKLDKTVLTLDNPTGPKSYHIDKSADITVILYKNKTVKVNRTYKKGEFKAEEVDNVLKDLPKILEAK
jgi:hypothetical protein